MPLFASNYKASFRNPFYVGKLTDCRIAGLKQYYRNSGKRNKQKYNWRGYMYQGAVKSELRKNKKDYDGLPIPDKIINDVKALNAHLSTESGEAEIIKNDDSLSFPNKTSSRYKTIRDRIIDDLKKQSSQTHESPDEILLYTIGFSSLESLTVIVGLPLSIPKNDDNKDANWGKKINLSFNKSSATFLEQYISEDIKSIKHSLRIDNLYIWPSLVELKHNKHAYDGILDLPQFFMHTIPNSNLFQETIINNIEASNPTKSKYPKMEDRAVSYFSLFYDTKGLLLYFVVTPSAEPPLRIPPGIVFGEEIHWSYAPMSNSLSVFPPKIEDWLVDR